MQRKTIAIAYEIAIAFLALLSVTLVVLDAFSVISLSDSPYYAIDLAILSVFWVDYLSRLAYSADKRKFFKGNLVDLIAIIPFSEFFVIFRTARLFRLIKFSKLVKSAKLLKAFGFITVLKKKAGRLLRTNGFIYALYCSVVLIFISAIIMSYVEGQSFLDALWWSIVTCTTVGYGDISPASGVGRVVAVILMLFGIGFIGMLTGAITTYFTRDIDEAVVTSPQNAELAAVLDTLTPRQQDELLMIAKAMKTETISLSVRVKVD